MKKLKQNIYEIALLFCILILPLVAGIGDKAVIFAEGAKKPAERSFGASSVLSDTDFPNLYSEQGIGTWYDKASSCHNPVMVDGRKECYVALYPELLNEDALTVAFNKAELGSLVKITNLDTRLSVVARVNDRIGADVLVDMTPRVRDELKCSDRCNVIVYY